MLSATSGVRVVGEAAGVHEALQLFAQCKPDAVVLDLQLPDGSGIDVLRTIKRDAPHCVVIVLTSHSGEEWKSACLSLGADHFLEKAREFERLSETLTQLQHS
jgi:DNA-binding NarL/FixJ family response regulator